ncbi:hypothetical protein PPACK8108_LOCUS21520 [Phakopsora pachyrhizi]|uniref:Uncharacterized protein n=1 Tax=Phakopsora pachyrhizi TaxID=170000 RepID=A0AAV0BKG5_PHAPC|nr:hypothetical protein PPACK8108_LOCUS21520 [Phakopsora pachyrhizi]
MTTPGDEEVRRPTSKNKKGGDLWSEDYPEVSKWMEARTDRLDYDLRGWEPVEYKYLKVYTAVNSESKISEYTEAYDLLLVAFVSILDGQVNMTCPVGKLTGLLQPHCPSKQSENPCHPTSGTKALVEQSYDNGVEGNSYATGDELRDCYGGVSHAQFAELLAGALLAGVWLVDQVLSVGAHGQVTIHKVSATESVMIKMMNKLFGSIALKIPSLLERTNHAIGAIDDQWSLTRNDFEYKRLFDSTYRRWNLLTTAVATLELNLPLPDIGLGQNPSLNSIRETPGLGVCPTVDVKDFDTSE